MRIRQNVSSIEGEKRQCFPYTLEWTSTLIRAGIPLWCPHRDDSNPPFLGEGI